MPRLKGSKNKNPISDTSRMGRPTKITQELISDMCYSINEDKLPIKYACQDNFICIDTHKNWMDKGYEDWREGKESLFVDYFFLLKKAEAMKLKRNLRTMDEMSEAGNKQWTAPAWQIERECPDYRLATKLEVTGAGGGPIQILQEENVNAV